MHRKGNLYDPRLDDAAQFLIAAKNGFGHVENHPDLISGKLPLQVYQLSIPAPVPPAGSLDRKAAERGRNIFNERLSAALVTSSQRLAK